MLGSRRPWLSAGHAFRRHRRCAHLVLSRLGIRKIESCKFELEIWEIEQLEVSNTKIGNLQIDNLEIDNLEIEDLKIPSTPQHTDSHPAPDYVRLASIFANKFETITI